MLLLLRLIQKKVKRKEHSTLTTIKGLKKQSECFAPAKIKEKVLKLKFCNFFEPLWFVQNIKKRRNVEKGFFFPFQYLDVWLEFY